MPQEEEEFGLSPRSFDPDRQVFIKARRTQAPVDEKLCYGFNDNSESDGSVTMYFVRHAESEWNAAKKSSWFNKFSLGLQFVAETLSEERTLMKDAELTKEGFEDAIALMKWIFYGEIDIHRGGAGTYPGIEKDREFLAGGAVDGRKAIFATSNLRRAYLTLLTVFYPSLLSDSDATDAEERSEIGSEYGEGSTDIEGSSSGSGSEDGERFSSSKIPVIFVLSALQEISKNIDAKTASIPGGLPDVNLASPGCPLGFFHEVAKVDPSCNVQDENVRESDGVDVFGTRRMNNFCKWVHGKVEKDRTVTDIIVSGHSSWLQHFFQTMQTGRQEYNEVEVWLRKHGAKLENGGLIRLELVLTPRGGCAFKAGKTQLVFGRINDRKSKAILMANRKSPPSETEQPAMTGESKEGSQNEPQLTQIEPDPRVITGESEGPGLDFGDIYPGGGEKSGK
jgi:hypothetical protein